MIKVEIEHDEFSDSIEVFVNDEFSSDKSSIPVRVPRGGRVTYRFPYPDEKKPKRAVRIRPFPVYRDRETGKIVEAFVIGKIRLDGNIWHINPKGDGLRVVSRIQYIDTSIWGIGDYYVMPVGWPSKILSPTDFHAKYVSVCEDCRCT